MLPTLNIILYTDYPTLFHENPLDPDGGLTDLEAFIKDKTKQFVNVNFQLVSRHGADAITGVELHGEEMITDQLLHDAHELWIFGRRMRKTSDEPHNELEDTEIEILERHMGPERRIGIFVTGDHSESPEGLACNQGTHDGYMSLGRALGRRMPIAGLLRDWDGPPTNCIELDFKDRDNFNTQDGFPPEELDDEDHETDAIPQTIKLDPAEPHRLFKYVDADNQIRLIEKLPDHGHEGIVLRPKELAGNWPADLPEPVVAAEGKDKRFPKENRVFPLVVAVDGDHVNKSRIVVDSSFHHYLDFNLRDIPSRNAVSKLPEPNSPLDQIAHFFGNLALWLAPKPIRDKINFDIMFSLARHSTVLEAMTLSDARLGKVSRHVLKTTIGPGRLQWLFGRSSSEAKDAVYDFFSLLFLSDEDTFPFRRIMSQDQLLGLTMRICDHLLTTHRIADVTRITQHKEKWQPLWTTFLTALRFAETEFKDAPEAAALNQLGADNESEGEEEMAKKCNHKWRSFIRDNEQDGLLNVKKMTGSKFTGTHEKPSGNVNFTGECFEEPFHRIEIATDEHFLYTGRIYDGGNERFAVGTRSKFVEDKDGKRKKLDDDEVWVGVKSSN